MNRRCISFLGPAFDTFRRRAGRRFHLLDVGGDFKDEMGKMTDQPEPKRSKRGFQVTHLRSATNNRALVVVTLLAVATALCWISWRVGSPLMTTIRNTDVELELRNQLEELSATPMGKKTP